MSALLARYRSRVEDFFVEEELLFAPQGEGEYCYLLVEKRGRTTAGIADQLARQLQLPAKAVAFAGRKDRRAVARQWFSLPRRCERSVGSLALSGVEVLAVERHDQRLRLGELEANRFVLVVRDIAGDRRDALKGRLATLERWGFSNRFGSQRFGRDGGNAERGARILSQGAAPRDRRHARLLVGALQAELFHQAIERRSALCPRGEDWDASEPGRRPIDRVVPGDLVRLETTGLVRRAGELDADQRSADRLELAPTAPMVGPSCRWAEGPVGELERELVAESGVALGSFRRLRLRGERRAVRTRLRDVAARWLPDGSLELSCRLAPGSYASVLLEELFSGIEPLSEGGAEDAASATR